MSEQIAVKFKKVELSWSELSSLSNDDRALLAFACFVVSEVNCLRNLTIQALHSICENPTAEKFVSVQRNTLVRILVSKLWEFSRAIEKKGVKLTGLSHKARTAVTSAAAELSVASKMPGAKLAESLRNKAPFHYDIGQFAKNIRDGMADFDAGFLIAEADGNCVFRMGEVVANGNEKSVNFTELLEWVQKLSRTITDFHLGLANGLIPSSLVRAREVVESVRFPSDLVATYDTRLPVLMSKTK